MHKLKLSFRRVLYNTFGNITNEHIGSPFVLFEGILGNDVIYE
tara:strand:- start:762 stop:890 length:129 start_codon:yes stop_codon:yes gene_type:complete